MNDQKEKLDEILKSLRLEILPEIESIIKRVINEKTIHKEFITRKETAQFFSISLVCLHDWVHKGIVKPYKMGNRTYFNRLEIIETLLSSNRKKMD